MFIFDKLPINLNNNSEKKLIELKNEIPEMLKTYKIIQPPNIK